jgi:hypothetical protein
VLTALGLLLMDAPEPVRDLIRDVRRHVTKLMTAERWVVMVAGPGGRRANPAD